LRLIDGHRRRHKSSTHLIHLWRRIIGLGTPAPTSTSATVTRITTIGAITAFGTKQADKPHSQGCDGGFLEDLAFGNGDVFLRLEALG
jgi:hypothetical protein